MLERTIKICRKKITWNSSAGRNGPFHIIAYLNLPGEDVFYFPLVNCYLFDGNSGVGTGGILAGGARTA